MQQLARQCLSGVRQHLVGGGIGIVVGFGLGLLAPSLGVFLSIGPLLMILLCLLPCLAPLLLLRWLGGGSRTRAPKAPASSVTDAGTPPVAR